MGKKAENITIKISYSTIQGCIVGLAIGLFACGVQYISPTVCPSCPTCPTTICPKLTAPAAPAATACPACPQLRQAPQAPPAKPSQNCGLSHSQITYNDILRRTAAEEEAMEATDTPRGVNTVTFTKEESEWIIKEGMLLGVTPGKIQDGATGDTGVENKINKKSRRAKVAALDRNSDKWAWVYDRLLRGVNAMNDKYWKYPIPTNFKSTLIETIQFLYYDEADVGMYSWHQDVGIRGNTAKRVLSSVTFLADANSYEGGRLQVKTVSEPWNIENDQGQTFIFPSYMLHQVTNLTKGKRFSLALWVQVV